MNSALDNRPWRRLHGVTLAAVCLLPAAGVYLNVNVADSLYRLKYGPVRPALLAKGWPLNAVEADAVSAVLRVDRWTLLADVCVVVLIAAGAGFKIERWRRKRQERLDFGLEHFLTLLILAAVVTGLEAVERANSLVDVIDYVAVFRWPALAVLFMGLTLTCSAIVDLVGLFARGLARRLGYSRSD